MRCRRDCVVSRLRFIDVSVGVHTVLPFVAREDFVSSIANHFIDIHVEAGVAPALPHIKRKLTIKLPCDHLVRSLNDGSSDILFKNANTGVRFSRSFFNFS